MHGRRERRKTEAFQKTGKGEGKERKVKLKERVSYNCLPILKGRRNVMFW